MEKFQIEALNEIDRTIFQNDLLEWFGKEQRDLPWRKDQDPYKVWVSEIMLQQTRVDTVIPYFERFMSWFPTMEAFSLAEEDKILKAWEGLGYYSRVRNLHSAVKEVQEIYGGKVPDTLEVISKLKGVGPYTAGAILSIAYGKPEPAVDGNVMRVLSRILLIKEDIAKPKTRKIFEYAVRELIAKHNTSHFNQALMELGALICTPGTPSCLLCPVREHCSAFNEGVQSELPIKNQKKSSKTVHMISAILTNKEGKILIRKRPSNGLLANLWEFPNFSYNTKILSNRDYYMDEFKKEFNVDLELGLPLSKIEHVFSHLLWKADIYSGIVVDNINNEVLKEKRLKWVDQKEIEELAFPVPFQKMYSAYLEVKQG
ncbi:A/G-specific adenine glycosylase [Peribacillus alkalitolerans]|uniref:A/G-specific adenine glycosylase n=1 Tax=Peribacillus alkalitolerans TaxID=1550385 RepID=UPI0013D6C42D|nr:A/G-specific adenine glycosylase [Peribacillus alkalitolerans]